MKQGYYWPLIFVDAQQLVKKCDKCQIFTKMPRAPPYELQLSLDILGPFPKVSGQKKFVIARVDYFTKWLEAEATATIPNLK